VTQPTYFIFSPQSYIDFQAILHDPPLNRQSAHAVEIFQDTTVNEVPNVKTKLPPTTKSPTAGGRP